MAEPQRIKFCISQDGTVTEEVMGVKGTQCLNLTEKIEEQLGDVQRRKETPEYYENENVTLQYNQNKNQAQT
tara:strand:- start:6880 stop:7095 length:216 start_codon:yes stop_codon:yes gene_type:complete